MKWHELAYRDNGVSILGYNKKLKAERKKEEKILELDKR